MLSGELCFTLQKANTLLAHLPVCGLALLILCKHLQLFPSLTAYLLLSYWDEAVSQGIRLILQLAQGKSEAVLCGEGNGMGVK